MFFVYAGLKKLADFFILIF